MYIQKGFGNDLYRNLFWMCLMNTMKDPMSLTYCFCCILKDELNDFNSVSCFAICVSLSSYMNVLILKKKLSFFLSIVKKKNKKNVYTKVQKFDRNENFYIERRHYIDQK